MFENTQEDNVGTEDSYSSASLESKESNPSGILMLMMKRKNVKVTMKQRNMKKKRKHTCKEKTKLNQTVADYASKQLRILSS